jgi:hypothetical protein
MFIQPAKILAIIVNTEFAPLVKSANLKRLEVQVVHKQFADVLR